MNFFEESYKDENGIYRWKSNNRIPFDDMLIESGIDSDTIQKCRVQRDKENDEFITEYKKQQEKFWNDPEFEDARQEAIAEMRSAHGSGVELINVFTGRKTKL